MSFQATVTQSFPKIICVGKNYLQHVKEMGGTQVPTTPLIFFKPWSSLSYAPKTLSLPISSVHRVDHELELGVFISKGGSNIPQETAFSHVGGYFIAIDFTDRDYQQQAKKAGFPWTLAKGQDNFCPVSPVFEGEVNPYSVQLELRVNGQTRQKDITGNMHFKIDEIISYTSRFIKLTEGDLILTGTPEGVSSVKAGDKIQAFGRYGENKIAQLIFEVVP